MSFKDDFYWLENEFKKQREEAKDQYWQNQEMTVGDYRGIVNSIPITFNVYQAGTQWSYLRNPVDLLPLSSYLCLGLAGETGELIDEFKKLYRNDKGKMTVSRKEKIKEEAGDALYYLAALLDSVDVSLEDVAKHSQEKCVQRFKERFMNEKANISESTS